MPLIQGGPPQWIWERTPNMLKWEVVPVPSPEGYTVYELKVKCGMDILRLQFFTCEELERLSTLIADAATEWPANKTQ